MRRIRFEKIFKCRGGAWHAPIIKMSGFTQQGCRPCAATKLFSVIISMLMISMITTGCEPLRKKFVRKKKQADIEETIPLFDPIVYPDKTKTPVDLYRQHYSLWQLWHTDLLTALEDNRSDKKIRYDLDQLSLQLQAMQNLVVAEKRQPLTKYAQALENVKQEMNSPAPLRNIHRMQTEIESLGKSMRQNFLPKNIGESLVK